MVGIYELNKRITLSGTWVYGSGNALTIPVGKYSSSTHLGYYTEVSSNNGQQLSDKLFNKYNEVQEYGEKNAFRAEAYHRLDFGIQFHKNKKRHERTWEISIYNVYNRRNPFFYQIDNKYDFTKGTTKTVLNRYSLFPIIPSFSYNFKF